MTDQPLSSQMEPWGYYLLPKAHHDSPGYSGLQVAMREPPTKQHFDPEKLHVRLCNEENLATWYSLKRQTPAFGLSRVCPGRVVLQDRFNKQIHFFTFGGSLETTATSDETVYALHSPAPILELSKNLTNIPDQLDNEVEAMMAQIEAAWGANDAGFAERLAQVQPQSFYQACLHTILDHYYRVHSLRDAWPRFYRALTREKEWLQATGQWPPQPPLLLDLLAPPAG